ncbi:hypothetical protein [Solemya velum gill symbiont]|uniref:Uncharacterized protein n=1 Tax=Solemya velum gill symbiont TaxID=2340 RepID=A0A1T2DDS0_SOVGS|nr:hypothetical protein [Solemya velum gill symbiont]OOY33753.1 hypothetical protein BOV88_13590 [Solemya velum gill symbiont]OOY36405.1 hypothetical protein BOV89_12760 [Solemya velum gill symbiont]OOY42423.1 hypothetical protein BOV92_13620 [Solemya velum gill symbiont]OOY45209.1 hypothetical protein BOV93_13505 [Solemya velum gill symbiont]
MSKEKNFKLLQGEISELQEESFNGLTLKVIRDSSTQRYNEKLGALHRALSYVHHCLPDAFSDLRLPILTVVFGEKVPCQVCWDNTPHGKEVYLFLGDKMMFQYNKSLQDELFSSGEKGPRGVCDQIYDDQKRFIENRALWCCCYSPHEQDYQSPVSAKATAIVVHELGHILHENNDKESFWQNNKIASPKVISADLARQVGSYVIGNNPNEFVAEVFTGLVYGKRYSEGIIKEYEKEGGVLPVWDIRGIILNERGEKR